MLIRIQAGSPPAFEDLGNQVNGSLSMSAQRIDAANKTSSGWAPAIAGLRQFQISADGQADPTDTVLEELIAAAIAGSEVNAMAQLYSTGNGYQATCQVTQMEINGPSQQFTQWRTQLEYSGGTGGTAPTATTSPL
jgi:predicted secreted protein